MLKMTESHQNGVATIESPRDMLKRLILEKRHEAIQQITRFKRRRDRGTTPQEFKLRSSVFGLFIEIEPSLKRKLNKQEYNTIKEEYESTDIEKVIKTFFLMNTFLDSIGVLKLDNGV